MLNPPVLPVKSPPPNAAGENDPEFCAAPKAGGAPAPKVKSPAGAAPKGVAGAPKADGAGAPKADGAVGFPKLNPAEGVAPKPPGAPKAGAGVELVLAPNVNVPVSVSGNFDEN